MVANVYSRRPLYVEVARNESAVARMAVRGAVFALLLAVATLITRRVGIVSYDELFWPLIVSGAAAAVSFALSIATLVDCWLRGTRGGWRALRAIALSSLVLVPFAFAAQRFVTEPPTADVTTDPFDPPRIVGAVGAPGATLQRGRRFEASIERVSAAAETALAELGWTVIERDSSVAIAEIDAPLTPPVPGDVPRPRMRPLTPEEEAARTRREAAARAEIAAERREEEARITYRALVRSAVLGVPSDIVIRLRDDGEATTLDLRARSRQGERDLGENRRRIASFLAMMDEVVQRDGVR